MALVTVRAVVNVPIHALVILVGLVLVRMLMATQAREHQIVLGIRVARVAGRRPAVRLREVRVIEHRAQPTGRAVARLAGGRETRCGVSRIRRVVVIRLVATDARCIRNVVVVIDVALRAGDRRSVETRQRPARSSVVELAICPQNCVVAGLAGGRETDGNVINRCLCVVVIRLVARHAGRVRQVVIVVHVALRAGRRRMEARQCPAGCRVVEFAVCPQYGVMAAFARRREAQRYVVDRSLRVVVVRLVAAYARRVGDLVVAVHVALQAGHRRVETGKRPACCAVVKLAVGPEYGVVAVLAGRWEPGLNVIHRRFRVVVVRLVAGHASRARQSVVVIDVALLALHRRMEARQRPACRRMIELAIRPQNRIVATFARRREAQRHVIDRSLRVVVIRLVARHASRTCQVVVIVDVALNARCRRMKACQRPARRRVIKLAVGPHHRVVAVLARDWIIQRYVVHWRLRVVVRRLVTGRASRAGQSVVVVDMALHARRRCVCARQREAGGRMIERRIHPVRRIVAAFARGWITQGDVIHRSFRGVVIRLMAGHASRAGQLIVVIDVAQSALQRGMGSRQRETCLRVIEGGPAPVNRGVAALAGRRQSQRYMVHRSLRVVVIRLMASHAGRTGQLIVVVDMALRALHGRVEARQRETRLRVIEGGPAPVHRAVATFAGRRQSQRYMVHRSLRVVVIRLMAGHAGRAGEVVIVVHVAQSALQRGMSTCQRETSQRVIERCGLPRHSRVAVLAGLG